MRCGTTSDWTRQQPAFLWIPNTVTTIRSPKLRIARNMMKTCTFDCQWLFGGQLLGGKDRHLFPEVCGGDFVCDIHRPPLFPHPARSGSPSMISVTQGRSATLSPEKARTCP